MPDRSPSSSKISRARLLVNRLVAETEDLVGLVDLGVGAGQCVHLPARLRLLDRLKTDLQRHPRSELIGEDRGAKGTQSGSGPSCLGRRTPFNLFQSKGGLAQRLRKRAHSLDSSGPTRDAGRHGQPDRRRGGPLPAEM